MKKCPICKETFPNTNLFFHSRPNRKDLSGYCKNCANKLAAIRITETRRALKKEATELFGRKCSICGFHESVWALAFHHIDPSKKDYVISSAKSLKKIKSEIDKCMLVCMNCHMEIHDGLHPEIFDIKTRVNNDSTQRRKIRMQEYINYLGSQCSKCGYAKCCRAMNFHHRNEDDKKFSIGSLTFLPKIEIMMEELDKCDLLCANCHQIHHSSLGA